MQEEWKDIKNYDGTYQVSSFGRIRSIRVVGVPPGYRKEKRKKIFYCKSNIIKSGYCYAHLYKKGHQGRKAFQIHRLVAGTFIPNPQNKPEPNHKDCNKQNNRVDNLEWVTKSENSKHAFKNGLLHLPPLKRGADNHNWKGGKPFCKICKKQLSVNRPKLFLCRECYEKPTTSNS